MLRELQDRVAYHLARPMICDIATPISFDQRDTLLTQLFRRDQQVAVLGRAAKRVGVRVFDQQQYITDHAGRALPHQLTLPLPRGPIVHSAGMNDVEHPAAWQCCSIRNHSHSIPLEAPISLVLFLLITHILTHIRPPQRHQCIYIAILLWSPTMHGIDCSVGDREDRRYINASHWFRHQTQYCEIVIPPRTQLARPTARLAAGQPLPIVYFVHSTHMPILSKP